MDLIGRIVIAGLFGVFAFTVAGCFTLSFHATLSHAITAALLAAALTFFGVVVGLAYDV